MTEFKWPFQKSHTTIHSVALQTYPIAVVGIVVFVVYVVVEEINESIGTDYWHQLWRLKYKGSSQMWLAQRTWFHNDWCKLKWENGHQFLGRMRRTNWTDKGYTIYIASVGVIKSGFLIEILTCSTGTKIKKSSINQGVGEARIDKQYW